MADVVPNGQEKQDKIGMETHALVEAYEVSPILALPHTPMTSLSAADSGLALPRPTEEANAPAGTRILILVSQGQKQAELSIPPHAGFTSVC